MRRVIVLMYDSPFCYGAPKPTVYIHLDGKLSLMFQQDSVLSIRQYAAREVMAAMQSGTYLRVVDVLDLR